LATKGSRWENVKKKFHDTIEKQIINDKPRKIALGCAFGIGINFFPTMGLGFVFAFLLAVIFRVNRATAAVTSLITGPLIPIMYTLNLLVGGLILTPVTGKENLVDFVIDQYAIILKLGNIEDKIFSFLEFFGATFILGAVVNATIFGTAFYYLVSYRLGKKAVD
jgi:uncharacterized protein (DUF2062 family)